MDRTVQGLLTFRPELDLLRAVAVTGVLYAHFWDESSVLGQLGVRLFFVLSGFLITDILLGLRAEADAGRGRRARLLFNFFIRRGLRLWPAYFLLLGGAVLVDFQDIRSFAGWHAAFLSNVLFAISNEHLPWATAAWWSLSLEEQFYFAWPALICLPPRRALPWLVGGLIYIGVLWQFGVEYTKVEGLAGYYLPPAAFPALGGGAAIALARRSFGAIPRFVEMAGWICTPLVVVLTVTGWAGWSWAALSVLPCVALVAWSVRGGGSVLGIGSRAWWKPVLWLGRISYGVYLYHMFVMAFIFTRLWYVPGLDHRGPALFACGFLLTVAAASISWVLVEAPFNRLKRFFPYRPAVPQPS